MNRIYADNAATTQMSPLAVEVMTDRLKNQYGNPSSLHTIGQIAKEELEGARQQVADVLNCRPTEIYFTAGGTEADNQAIRSAALMGARRNKKHIISTKFEHHAVLHTLSKLEKEGFEVTLLEVYSDGLVRLEDVKNALREDTALVTIMFANNEVGTIQPIAEIGALCHEAGVPFHTDAVQAAGHQHIDVEEMHIDMLSLSGHKFHGPKGVGALYVRRSLPLLTFIEGGAQERGKRAGTENLPGIIAMAAALADSNANIDAHNEKVSAMRDKLIAGVLAVVPHAQLNGHPTQRLAGNISFCFEGIEGEALLLYLDAMGVCASSGSACTSGSLDPSHVLLSLGLPHDIAHGSLRLSICEYNTEEEVDAMIKIVPQVVEKIRAMSPVWHDLQEGKRQHVIQ